MRLRSDIWIAGYLRRVMAGGAFTAVVRKGVPEAGAIFIRVNHLDGHNDLFGPAPQSLSEDDAGGRRFIRLMAAAETSDDKIEQRLGRETGFDPDCWIIEVEDRAGRSFLDDDIVG